MAAESFSAMSADEISKAVASAGSSMPPSAAAAAAGLPPGAQITPEMQRAAAEVIGKLSPEDQVKMQAMAATMTVPSGGGMPQITPEMAEMVGLQSLVVRSTCSKASITQSLLSPNQPNQPRLRSL